jgi:Holliday junction resolvasome RuvABC ATP-dependent DNA helicase subunit
MKTTSGPAVEHAGDLASILTSLQEGEVLFIDEISWGSYEHQSIPGRYLPSIGS